MPLRVIYIDLNSYFASVEQQARPELRGRPVAVVPLDTDSTCCIAASREAKRFGVKTGTRVGEARRMCPGLVTVPARPELYIRFHHRILAAVDTCLPVEKVWSIDEMHGRLLGDQCRRDAAEALARQAKAAILAGAGECLTCSIGIAPNRVLAKAASDMVKPDGLVVIEDGELPQRLFSLELTDLPGIGPRMGARLNRAGVTTIESLCGKSETELVELWGGVVGRYWWHWLRGNEPAEVPTRTRSIGHEHVLAPELRTADGARAVMVKLIHKAAARARHAGYRAGALTLRVKFVTGGDWESGCPLAPRSSGTRRLLAAMAGLWDAGFPRRAGPPMKVAMHLHDLESCDGGTAPLFEADRAEERLSSAMDRINARFGRDAVYAAAMHPARGSAPLRIAFGSVPDLKVP